MTVIKVNGLNLGAEVRAAEAAAASAEAAATTAAAEAAPALRAEIAGDLSAAQDARDGAEQAEQNAVDISNIAIDDDIVELLVKPGAAGSKTKVALSDLLAHRMAAREAFELPPPLDRPEVLVAATSTTALSSPVVYKPAIVGIGSSTTDWDGASDTNIRYGGAPGSTTTFYTANGGSGDLGLYGSLKPGGDLQAAFWPVIYEFNTTSPQVEIYCFHKIGDAFLIEVNGRLLSDFSMKHATYAAGNGRISLNFPAPPENAQARRIRVFATGSHGLSEIRVPTGNTIAKPAARSLTLAVIGDSWINGASEITPVDSFGAGLLRIIDPTADVILAGIGARGWIANSNGGSPNPYSTSLTAVLAADPDVLVFYGSQNDGNISVQTQVTAALSTASAVPKILLVPTLLSGYDIQAASIAAAATAAGRTYVPVAGVVNGSGYLDAPQPLAGNRSRFVYSASDLHMNRAGHRFAREIIHSAIPANV